jgi:hypothetical protein
MKPIISFVPVMDLVPGVVGFASTRVEFLWLVSKPSWYCYGCAGLIGEFLLLLVVVTWFP